jgi:peptide/nickel transport system substrate-binding protein
MKKYFYFLVTLFAVVLFALTNIGILHAQKKPIELRWGVEWDVATLDPIQQQTNWDFMLAVNLYDTLIYPDLEKGHIPWIAESWKISPDGMKYTFRLKKGIPFHDGTEITAEDVSFSMWRMLKLEGPAASNFTSLKPEGIKVPDKYTVEFNLTKKDPSFMAALFTFKIMSKGMILKNKEEGKYGELGDLGVKYLQTHDAGSGPFAVVEKKPGNYVRLRRFENYPFFQRKPGSIDLVTVYIIPEMVTIGAKLRKGELDMCTWGLPYQVQNKLKESKSFVVEEIYPPVPWYVFMNNKKKPLDCPYVRKAIAYAYDFETVTTKILPGGKRLQGPVPEVLREGCAGIKTYPFDLEKAKVMLNKSKYSLEELKQFNLDIAAVAGSERFKNTALLLSTNLKKIGLNAQVKTIRIVDINQAAAKPETAYPLVIYMQAARVPHPYFYLVYYTPEGSGIGWAPGGIYYENAKVTEAISMAKNSLDPTEQKRYYCQAQKQIAEDCPIIFSHEEFRLVPFWRYVKGFRYPVACMFFELRFESYTMDTEDPLFKENHGW